MNVGSFSSRVACLCEFSFEPLSVLVSLTLLLSYDLHTSYLDPNCTIYTFKALVCISLRKPNSLTSIYQTALV